MELADQVSSPLGCHTGGESSAVRKEQRVLRWNNIDNAPPACSASRACDRCVRRKVKCDKLRPACSRCRDAGDDCRYTSTRRKPGPAKGIRPKVVSRLRQGEGAHHSTCRVSHAEKAENEHHGGSKLAQQQPQTHDGWPSAGPNMDLGHGSINHCPIDTTPLPLSQEDETRLVQSFLTHLNPAFALFEKTSFQQQYEAKSIPSALLKTILLVTQHVLPHDLRAPQHASSILDALNVNTFVDLETLDECISVGVFQQACLLTYYDFHQNPGPGMWMKAGHLTRQAYRYGLNELDNEDQCALYSFKKVQGDEIDAWRRVWWFIYRLDSFSNSSSGTPFVIELEGIRTALLRNSATEITSHSCRAPLVFLPHELGHLWKTASAIVRSGGYVHQNIHIITTTLLREANRLHRLRIQAGPSSIYSQVSEAKKHVSAVRMALPAGYLCTWRDVSIGESESEVHARLACVLHLHMAGLLLSLPPFSPQEADTWFNNWACSLRRCEDIVAVLDKWDGPFLPIGDPSICFIALTALLILQLHARCGHADDHPTLASIESQSNALLLFLDRSSSSWALPRILKSSFMAAVGRMADVLTPSEVEHLIKTRKAPLHGNFLRHHRRQGSEFLGGY